MKSPSRPAVRYSLARQSAVGILLGGVVIAAAAVADEPAADSSQAAKNQASLETALAKICETRGVPGLVAGMLQGDRLTLSAAAGVRKAGSDVPLTVDDKLHLGSCTKSMTATWLARRIDASQLSWETTLGEAFADLREKLHPDFHAVTLEQLLTHRAGVPANGPWRSLGDGSVVSQREAVLTKVLGQPPVHPPGTKFLYSNVGYVVAAHMVERSTGRSWEELISEGIFQPLKMTTAGFGPPGTKGEVDQPWGHLAFGGKSVPLQEDNAAVLGPAGTVHCSLADWARFAQVHLAGASGAADFLKADTLRRLHTPPSEGEPYAGGWGVLQRDWAGGRVLTHNGSNTMWLSSIWIAPERNVALLAVANQGGEAGQRACDEAMRALIGLIPKGAEPADK